MVQPCWRKHGREGGGVGQRIKTLPIFRLLTVEDVSTLATMPLTAMTLIPPEP